jgi:hypothetical protein
VVAAGLSSLVFAWRILLWCLRHSLFATGGVCDHRTSLFGIVWQAMAARLWTHGYDFFAPPKQVSGGPSLIEILNSPNSGFVVDVVVVVPSASSAPGSLPPSSTV